jgi:Asp-tRNA(Asn)/Glu-tRNA(Gln) amidotransferase B subunit
LVVERIGFNGGCRTAGVPYAKYQRFMNQYGLSGYNAWRLTEEQAVADYFERAPHFACRVAN